MKQDFIFTSEAVTEGHPDKLCDQISDAVVDNLLQQDPFARVEAECAVSNGIVFVAAHFDARASIDVGELARQVIQQAGYQDGDFNARDCSVMTSLGELPPRPMRRVDERLWSEEEVDAFPVSQQGTFFGFACNQSAALMPLPIWLAQRLARRLAAARLGAHLPYLGPDGKTQVAVEFHARRPNRIHSITLLASQAAPGFPAAGTLEADLREWVIGPAFFDQPLRPDDGTHIFMNPEGPWRGGPTLHSGLTGRKTGMDTYGEYARHSGTALSGKDPMRIDRIAAYAARHAAKNVVAAGLADECEVQLSYTIGLAHPVSVQVETFGTGRLADEEIAARLEQHCDFRLAGIIRRFQLRHLPGIHKGGFYRKLAAYGQVGRMDIGLPWERADCLHALGGQSTT